MIEDASPRTITKAAYLNIQVLYNGSDFFAVRRLPVEHPIGMIDLVETTSDHYALVTDILQFYLYLCLLTACFDVIAHGGSASDKLRFAAQSQDDGAYHSGFAGTIRTDQQVQVASRFDHNLVVSSAIKTNNKWSKHQQVYRLTVQTLIFLYFFKGQALRVKIIRVSRSALCETIVTVV